MMLYFIRFGSMIQFFETAQDRTDAAGMLSNIVEMGRAEVTKCPTLLLSLRPFIIHESHLGRDSKSGVFVFSDTSMNIRYASAPFDRVRPPVDMITPDPLEQVRVFKETDRFVKYLFPMHNDE